MHARSDSIDDLGSRSIVTTRIIDAPRELVFEAWSHPNHLRHWFGPNGFSITTSAFDFRPGGIWRFVMHGPDGRDYQNRVTFDEIVAPELLRYHHGGDENAEPVSFDMTVRFENEAGKTRLTMRHVFKTAQERDRVVAEFGAEKGARQTLGRLAEYTADWKTTGGLEKAVKLTRLIKAPRELVFRCFTEAEHLAKWWGPDGFTNPRCEIDARPGGKIFILMEGPGNFSHPMTGTVQEVAPFDRFVFMAVATDGSGTALLESRTTVTFADEGKATRLTVEARAKGLVPLARMMLAGMEAGWSQSLDRLVATAVELAS